MRVLDISRADEAVAILLEYFPRSTADADEARFVINHLLSLGKFPDAPRQSCRIPLAQHLHRRETAATCA
jgi:hypothetical protein